MRIGTKGVRGRATVEMTALWGIHFTAVMRESKLQVLSLHELEQLNVP